MNEATSAGARAVLGIDAAWTAHRPSGVALAVETNTGWRLIAAEPSYERFHARAGCGAPPSRSGVGSPPDAMLLLKAATVLAQRPIDLIAIDMPLARGPITGRRASDNAVTSAYGSRWCGTHTPSSERPGRISDDLTAGFAGCGFALCTTSIAPRGVIEVYPHPALVELAREPVRLPYKASRTRQYWPLLSPSERRAKLHLQWMRIVALLDAEIGGVTELMGEVDPRATGATAKAYEDRLDAVVCAWIAIRAVQGCARPFGNHHSAIWIPTPVA